MDETSLRAMFERAVAERPPTPDLVANSVRAGFSRRRKRRRIGAAAGSVAAVALISALVLAAAGEFGRAAPPPAAVAGPAVAGTAYIWTGNDTVTPVRLSTGTVLTPVTVPNVIQDIAATPDGKAVYVFSNSQTSINKILVSYVTEINGVTGKAGRPVKLTGNSLVQDISDVRVAPDGKVAYATESGTWPANGKYGGVALVEINLTTGAQRVLTQAGGAWQIAPGARTAYSAGSDGEVDEFDLASGRLLPPVKLRVPWSRGSLLEVALTPGGRTLWAMSVSRATPAEGAQTWVTPISTATDIAASPIEVRFAGEQTPGIVAAPDGDTGYVSGGRYLYPVSLAAGRALTPITLPSAFADYFSSLSFSPDSKFGEEYQPRSATVQLINFSSGSVPEAVALPGSYRQSSPGIFAGGDTVYVPASIFRGALPSLGALVPVQLATQRVGKAILFSGVPNGAVVVP